MRKGDGGNVDGLGLLVDGGDFVGSQLAEVTAGNALVFLDALGRTTTN